jgi:acetylornithine deacetylase
MIRVVSDLAGLKKLILGALDDRVQVTITSETPALHLKSLAGFETAVMKYTTDIPKLSRWGQPLLLGPGSIRFAHTDEEHIPKRQMVEAVELYKRLVKQLRNSSVPA